jgi:hypothetical protein
MLGTKRGFLSVENRNAEHCRCIGQLYDISSVDEKS